MKTDFRFDLECVLGDVKKAIEPATLMRRFRREIRDFIGDGNADILAVGKASAKMVVEADELCYEPVWMISVLTTPEAAPALDKRGFAGPTYSIMPCDHPIPTQRNDNAALCAQWSLSQMPPDRRLLVLLSGGGSAFLTRPAVGVSMEELAACSRELMRRGADIRELNTVRKQIERIKGGRLGKACTGAQILVLVISDVIGDPLDVIASGPFMPDTSTPAQAIEVLRRYELWGTFLGINKVLESGSNVVVDDQSWVSKVTHRVIGNNQTATKAAASSLRKRGYRVARPLNGRQGSVEAVAAELLATRPKGGKEAWVLGGEWVVNAAGSTGNGGPSQELALRAALAGQGQPGWALLAYSTDGVDGPTDAAGAIVDGETVSRCRDAGCDAVQALANHDSHTALAAAGVLLRTGPTGTNVNHVAVLVRES